MTREPAQRLQTFKDSVAADRTARWLRSERRARTSCGLRAVRFGSGSDPQPLIQQLTAQLGVHHVGLRNWIRQDQADEGEGTDPPTTHMLEEKLAQLVTSQRDPEGRRLFSHRSRPDPRRSRVRQRTS
jgi:hypothetical protein